MMTPYAVEDEEDTKVRQILIDSTAPRNSFRRIIQESINQSFQIRLSNRLQWIAGDLITILHRYGDLSMPSPTSPILDIAVNLYYVLVSINKMRGDIDTRTLEQLAILIPTWFKVALDMQAVIDQPIINFRPAEEGESRGLTTIKWKHSDRTLSVEIQGDEISYLALWYENGDGGGLRVQDGEFNFEEDVILHSIKWLVSGQAPER